MLIVLEELDWLAALNAGHLEDVVGCPTAAVVAPASLGKVHPILLSEDTVSNDSPTCDAFIAT